MERQNIRTELWGRSGWTNIHYLAKNKNDKNAVQFILSLQDVLPCILCREHTKKYVSEKFDKNLELFAFNFHNAVNIRLGKKVLLHDDYVNLEFKPDWIFFHAITFGYPHNPSSKIKKQYLTFFTATKYIFFPELEINAKDFENQGNLVQWFYNFHKKMAPEENMTQKSFYYYYNLFMV